MPPANRHNPTMPFNTIMTTANTVSRANPALSAANDSMMETMSATSITVTAKASTNVPNGSPMRWATTSAWCTAANTLAIKAAPAMTATAPLASANSMITSITQAAAGQSHAHQGMRDGAAIAKGSFQDRARLHEAAPQGENPGVPGRTAKQSTAVRCRGPSAAPATRCAGGVVEIELLRWVALVLLLVAPAKVRGGWGAGGRVHARWQRADDGARQLLS